MLHTLLVGRCAHWSGECACPSFGIKETVNTKWSPMIFEWSYCRTVVSHRVSSIHNRTQAHTQRHSWWLWLCILMSTNDEVENFVETLHEQRTQNYFHASKIHKSCNLLSLSGYDGPEGGKVVSWWAFVFYLSDHSSSASSFSPHIYLAEYRRSRIQGILRSMGTVNESFVS